MAFANLFTKLCDVDEAGKDSIKFTLSHRNETKNKQQGPSRKRKLQTEQAGAYLERQCFQQQSARAFNAGHKHDPRAMQGHRTINRTSKDARPGVSSEVPHNHKDKAWCNDHSEGNRNNANMWKTKKKKNKGKKKQENAQRYRNYNKGGRGRNEGIKQLPKRFTQEFIKQHALEVDGRLICIYFLRGKCIKGEECQLEHIEGHNDLIKEVCKFYVQGFCLKGESCPYMHQSFPCKFFHKKGNCGRDDCKFSHDPLNDFTEKLLDDAIKRENELLEHHKKAEEGSLSQPENVSEAVEEKTIADIIVQPVRPNFYESSDTNIEEEALLSANEQPANLTEEDDVEPDNSAPSDLNNSGPVCYSVEAVLGRQHYKPFLYTALGNLESPLSVPKTTTDNILNPANAPYSLNNVRKCKSDFTGNHLRIPPIAQTVAAMFEVKDSDTSVTLDDEYKVSHLNNQEKLQENLLKQPPSFHVSAGSGYCQKQCENSALKPALSGTERLSESNKTKEGHKEIRESLLNQVPTDKSLTSDFKSQYFPLIGNLSSAHNCHTPKQTIKEKSKQSFAIFKDKTATNQATPYHQTLQETNTGPSLDTPQSHSIKNVAGNKQESVLSSNLAASSNKTTTRPFHSLFASLVPDSAQPSSASNSFTDKPAVPSGQSIQKSHCDSQKVDCSLKQATKPNNFTENTTKRTNTKETSVGFAAACSETSNSQKLVSTSNSKNIKDATRGDKTSAKSFLSLFAAPLSESITPNKSKVSCSQEPAPSIDDKRSDVKRSNKISSQTSSPENTKTESCYRTEANTNEHKKDMASNVSSNSSNKTTRQTQHQSHNGPSSSVLRTLFQHLRPYEQQEGHWDHVKISVHSERKTDDNNGGCASAVQLKKRGKKHNAKAKAASLLPHSNSTVKSDAPPFHHPTSLQTLDVPLPAHRTPSSPCGPGTLSQKPSSELNTGNTGASLKDLFKTLHPLKQ